MIKSFGIVQNKITGQFWQTRMYSTYEKAYMAAKRLGKRHIPADNLYIIVEQECNHRYLPQGRADKDDMGYFSPGDECPLCGYTLGTDYSWYIDRDQAPGYPDFKK